MKCTAVPFEIKPGEPQLTGKLHYGPPHAWRVQVDEEKIEIVVDDEGLHHVQRFFLWTAGTVAILTFVICRFWLMSPMWKCICAGLFPAVALCGGAAYLEALRRRESQKGPIFRYAGSADHPLELPRLGIQIDRQHAVRWILVDGGWVRRDKGNPQQWGDLISELHLVVEDDGNPIAYPLVGGLGARELKDVATKLSMRTDLPLEYKHEPRTLRNPYKAADVSRIAEG